MNYQQDSTRAHGLINMTSAKFVWYFSTVVEFPESHWENFEQIFIFKSKGFYQYNHGDILIFNYLSCFFFPPNSQSQSYQKMPI